MGTPFAGTPARRHAAGLRPAAAPGAVRGVPPRRPTRVIGTAVCRAVDEVRGPIDRVSAVVHGAFSRLDPAATPKDREVAARAAALLDTVVPNTRALGDPVPFRRVLFRVSVDEVSGRRALSAV